MPPAFEPSATDPSNPRSSSVSSAGSHVRRRPPEERLRASRRVAEYFRMLGLEDPDRLCFLAESIAESIESRSPEEHAESAMRVAQGRVREFCAEVFREDLESPDPLWLRAFLAAHPEVFLGDVAEARRVARLFGDVRTGKAPRCAEFREQKLEPTGLPKWLVGLLAPGLLTVAATVAVASELGDTARTFLGGTFLFLFAFLFGLAAVGLSTATVGAVVSKRRVIRVSQDSAEVVPRTALLFPIYHESAEHVFAAVAAVRESMLKEPALARTEIFVLSDSQDPFCAADEERAFRRVSALAEGDIPIYYRRRAVNLRKKTGNLAEFFERFGRRYTYAIVLDADSLMTGATIRELIARMEKSPKLALLQAPIEPAQSESLLGRSLQWATGLSGPLFTAGLAAWSDSEANYYGHNAILRVDAFLDCCALPALKGEPPLGGEILSHDFVEAALLVRGGWHVQIAADLNGSYEGLPPTLSEYVARDRRWCQGNLQHLRVALADGLHPMSRVHLLLGAAAYLAAPAWLAFLVLGAVLVGREGDMGALAWPTVFTFLVLLGPRALGVAHAVTDAEVRRQSGGVLRILASSLTELIFSALLAPLLMVHHTLSVLSVFAGKSVRWGAQKRHGGGGLVDAFYAEWPTTLLGVATGLGTSAWNSTLGVWLAPVWIPWCLSIFISAAASSDALGNWLRRWGILTVRSETEPHEILGRVEALRAWTTPDDAGRFRDIILDPVLVRAHLTRLGASEASSLVLPTGQALELCRRALRVGPAGLSREERDELLQDPSSLQFLHMEAWCAWPVETWELARAKAQVPLLLTAV